MKLLARRVVSPPHELANLGAYKMVLDVSPKEACKIYHATRLPLSKP